MMISFTEKDKGTKMRKFYKLLFTAFLSNSVIYASGDDFSRALIQNEGMSLGTPTIATSAVYTEVKPLSTVQIHPYNPELTPSISIRVPHMGSELLASEGAEKYIVINRPVDGSGPLLLRPHYWVARNAPQGLNVEAKATVIDFAGNKLLDGSHNVHVHDRVCSPNNMGIRLAMEAGNSHLLYSLVEHNGAQALTCHWIPTSEQWEKIWNSEFSNPSSENINELMIRLSSLFPEDLLENLYFQIIREILISF